MFIHESNPCDEGVIQAAESDVKCEQASKYWVLTASILGSSMAFIDGSVVNVALPSIQTALSAAVSDMQWVVNAYAVILGALVLTGGSAGDLYGRKRVFTTGIIIFTLASAWCGMAPNVFQLIIGRAVQGLGGALLIPSSLALISSAFGNEERGKAIGTWSGFTAITTALGPVLGGWLVDEFSWRPIFYLNIPLGLIVLFITLRFVPENTARDAQGKLDWWGTALATGGLGCLCYGLIKAAETGFGDFLVFSTIVAGILLIIAFVAVEYFAPHPMMPLRLFHNRTFTGANLLTLFLYFALSGVFFFLPFNLIQIQGYSATAAGAAFLPFTLILGTLSRWSGGLIDKYGPKLPLMVGPMTTAIGFWMLSLPGQGGSYWGTFFPGITVIGVGMAISVAPLTTTVMSAVSQDEAGTASGINNAVARISGMLAVAVLGVIMIATFADHLGNMVSAAALPSAIQKTILNETESLAAIDLSGLEADTQQKLQEFIDASFIRGFRFIMHLSAGLAALSALFSWLFIKQEVLERGKKS